MEIELINRKPFIFRVKDQQYEFVKPYYLMKVDGLNLIKGVVKGSCLCWNIQGYVISYNQLKTILKQNKDVNSFLRTN